MLTPWYSPTLSPPDFTHALWERVFPLWISTQENFKCKLLATLQLQRHLATFVSRLKSYQWLESDPFFFSAVIPVQAKPGLLASCFWCVCSPPPPSATLYDTICALCSLGPLHIWLQAGVMPFLLIWSHLVICAVFLRSDWKLFLF